MLEELGNLLPGCSIHLLLVGPAVPQAMDGQQHTRGELLPQPSAKFDMRWTPTLLKH